MLRFNFYVGWPFILYVRVLIKIYFWACGPFPCFIRWNSQTSTFIEIFCAFQTLIHYSKIFIISVYYLRKSMELWIKNMCIKITFFLASVFMFLYFGMIRYLYISMINICNRLIIWIAKIKLKATMYLISIQHLRIIFFLLLKPSHTIRWFHIFKYLWYLWHMFFVIHI